MILGSLSHVVFRCDGLGCRERAKGRMVDIPGTPKQVAVEPAGWEKRNIKRPSGMVFRHYCPACCGPKENG